MVLAVGGCQRFITQLALILPIAIFSIRCMWLNVVYKEGDFLMKRINKMIVLCVFMLLGVFFSGTNIIEAESSTPPHSK